MLATLLVNTGYEFSSSNNIKIAYNSPRQLKLKVERKQMSYTSRYSKWLLVT